MNGALIQNKYGELKPLENERVEASDDVQLVYATGFLKAVNDAIDDIKHRSYFIGFRLDEANRYKYYEALGYANIEELAEAEFGFKRSTTYGLMQAFNYAKSETPLYIADKFRGYSYTALLEMSKAKTIRGSGGIETILTPKDSVSKIKEVRSLWNKYLEDNGTLPDCKTADEFLELVKKPAPAPLLELVELVETPEPEETRVQSIGLTEPEEPEQTDEEFEAELNETAELVTLPDNELIEYVLKESNHIDKFKLQDTVLKGDFITSEFIKYVKNEYGTGGWGGGYAPYDDVTTDYKGLAIKRRGGGKLILSWSIVAGRIKRLIEKGEYLNADEQAQYIQWKAEQDGLVVNVVETSAQPAEENKVQSTGQSEPEAATLPIDDKEYDKLIKNLDSLIKPKNKTKTNLLNLKNEKARKTWLDGFRSWGVWLEVPQVDKTFYRFDFANGAALIAEISAGYNDWYDGSVHEYERVEYSLIDDKHPKFNSHGISNTEVIKWLTAHAKEV